MKFHNLLSLVVLLAVSNSFLFAQDSSISVNNTLSDTIEVPTLTVTTTRAIEQKSPVAFSNINKDELELRYSARDLPQLLQYQPSIISYSENGNFIGYTNMSMRGFDQRRMSVLINGIPQNDPADHNVYWINFSDIGSSLYDVQIQRGAGLMNYGAAAIAGSISLTTSIEANQPGIRYSTGIGLQEFGAEGEIKQNITKNLFEYSSGLTEIGGTNYAFYGKIARINSEGYRDQSWAQLTSWFLSGVRFDENFSTQINVWGGSQRDGLAYIGLPKSSVEDLSLRRKNYNYWEHEADGRGLGFASPVRAREVEDFSSPHFEVLNDWNISESVQLKSSLFYYTGAGYFDFNGSWATDDMFRLDNEYTIDDGDYATNSIIRSYVRNGQGGWIPRLVWDHEGGELTAGIEMRWHNSNHWGKLQFAENLPVGYDPDFKIYEYEGHRTILSAFARESYELNDMITIQAGGQLVYHNYSLGNERVGGRYAEYETAEGRIRVEGDLFGIDYVFFNPRAGVMLNLDENNSAYASVALTTREPRMNNLYNASESYSDPGPATNIGGNPLFAVDTNGVYDFSNPLIKPEQMLDIEIGYRYTNSWMNVGAGGYWMEFTDELVKDGQLNIFGAPIDGNAPKTRHLGLELDARVQAWEENNMGIVIGGNTTISYNELVEYSVFMADRTIDLSGNEIAGFPPFILNTFVQYDWAEFKLRANLRHVGAFKTDNFGDLESNPELVSIIGYADNEVDSYTVMSLDLAYRLNDFLGTQSLTIRAQVENLTNELYAASGIGQNFFPAAERSYYFGMEVGL